MTDNTALAQELETLRSRETQMLGAAISRRNWQDVEAAYNQLRDRQDGPIAAVLRTPAPAPVGGDVVGLLNAILDAQNAQPYRGWNITKLNKAVDAAREHLGLPSIRELNPDIAAMQDHARANKDAIQSALQAQPAPAQGDDVLENLLGDMFEDASVDDLEGVEAFNAAQKTQTWWGDEKRKIRVPDALLAERSKGEGND